MADADLTPLSFRDALRADGPHPEHREQLMQFGRFVGTWSVQVRLFQEGGGTRYDELGYWTFEWVLDGRAVQDVLIVPNYDTGSARVGERHIGSTMRYFDPGSGQWRVVWLGATSGILAVMTGRAVGEEMWIEATDPDGAYVRWMFTKITPDSFDWKGLISQDGEEWVMVQEMLATRIAERDHGEPRGPPDRQPQGRSGVAEVRDVGALEPPTSSREPAG